jgi:cell division protein FtsB
MLNTKQFGFVIWGVRNGFNRDILSSDKVAEVSAAFNDSMRQICNGVIDCFYSIEKTANYTLLTVYNPSTADHVQRKAYIAITLFAKNGTNYNGEVVAMLNSLMNYNIQKQGSAIVNTFTESMFEEQIQNISAQVGFNNDAIGSKLGYIAYNTIDEIENYFKKPSIDGYKKVFFYQKAINITLPAEFEKVTSFKKALRISVLNYNAKNFILFLNGQKLNPITENNIDFNAAEGDTLKVTEINTGSSKEFSVTKNTIDLRNYFLPKSQPQTFVNHQHKNKKNNKKKVILTSVITLLLLMVVYGLIQIFDTDDPIDNKTAQYDNETVKPDTLGANNTTLIVKDTLNSRLYSALEILNENLPYKANKKIYKQKPYFKKTKGKIEQSKDNKTYSEVRDTLEVQNKFKNIYFKLINGDLKKYNGNDTVVANEVKMDDDDERKSVESIFKQELGLTINSNTNAKPLDKENNKLQTKPDSKEPESKAEKNAPKTNSDECAQLKKEIDALTTDIKKLPDEDGEKKEKYEKRKALKTKLKDKNCK